MSQRTLLGAAPSSAKMCVSTLQYNPGFFLADVDEILPGYGSCIMWNSSVWKSHDLNRRPITIIPKCGFFSKQRLLRILKDHDSSHDFDNENSVQSTPVTKTLRRSYLLGVIMVVMVILTLIGLSVLIIVSSLSSTEGSKSLRFRREWRTLTKTEKELYIDAAVCLTQTPSQRTLEWLFTIDFSYLHSRIGNYCKWICLLLGRRGIESKDDNLAHNAAPFLPWHRYFIHSYENALKDHCGFKGTLPWVQ